MISLSNALNQAWRAILFCHHVLKLETSIRHHQGSQEYDGFLDSISGQHKAGSIIRKDSFNSLLFMVQNPPVLPIYSPSFLGSIFCFYCPESGSHRCIHHLLFLICKRHLRTPRGSPVRALNFYQDCFLVFSVGSSSLSS